MYNDVLSFLRGGWCKKQCKDFLQFVVVLGREVTKPGLQHQLFG
jgi:hypothetical protein